jgi:hypothetical protein
LRAGDSGAMASIANVVDGLAWRLEHIETIVFAALKQGGVS